MLRSQQPHVHAEPQPFFCVEACAVGVVPVVSRVMHTYRVLGALLLPLTILCSAAALTMLCRRANARA
jgi:hypothetical protein